MARRKTDEKKPATGLKGYVKDLCKELDEQKRDDTFLAYLNVMAQFHHYSPLNLLRIALQQPDASRVASASLWKSIGREVATDAKGNRVQGIRILAPVIIGEKKEESEDMGADLDADPDEPDTRASRTTGGRRMWFKEVQVYDISQTAGEPLPEFYDAPSGDNSDLYEILAASLQERGIPVHNVAMPHGARGVFMRDPIDARRQVIGVDREQAGALDFKTLVHESAHAILHGEGKFTAGETDEELNKQTREIEAEAAAYVVCRRLGVEVNFYSARYLTMYRATPSSIKARLENISKAAKEILTMMRVPPNVLDPEAIRQWRESLNRGNTPYDTQIDMRELRHRLWADEQEPQAPSAEAIPEGRRASSRGMRH